MMHNRIYELAKEADLIEFDAIPGSDAVTPDYTSVVKAQKFAELIIRESINVLNKRFMGDLNREDMEVRRCIESLQTYFGVK